MAAYALWIILAYPGDSERVAVTYGPDHGNTVTGVAGVTSVG